MSSNNENNNQPGGPQRGPNPPRTSAISLIIAIALVAYLVYSMVSSEIIDATDPTQMRVVAPVIDDVSWSETPTERWMTMTTCHPEYGNWQRYIVHLKFESWTPKDTGVPAELVDEPTN